MSRASSCAAVLLLALLHGTRQAKAAGGRIESAPRDSSDRYTFTARSETHLRWFERALLPGPNGAIVRAEPMVPVYEYLGLEVSHLDLLGTPDAVDIQLAGFSRVSLVRPEGEPPIDGDISVANVRYQHRGRSLRLGRQHAAGGAARYVRFDGLSADAALTDGLALGFYGGFTVLPHWNQRPGYYYLGSTVDSLARDPDALGDPSRGGYWLAGIHASYRPNANSRIALSFHEQMEASELAHQRLGAEGQWSPAPELELGTKAIVDTAAARFSEAELVADWQVAPHYTLSVEYLHTVPALFLSHQSVLSVFSVDSYDEAGAVLGYRPTNLLSAEASAFGQRYDGGDLGLRSELRVRIVPDAAERVTWQVHYGRLVGSGMGYHSLRNSLRYRVSVPVSVVGDASLYFYDREISGQRTSSVYAANVEWSNDPGLSRGAEHKSVRHLLRVLWGASLVNSPFAHGDLQTLVRLIYSAEGGRR